MKNWPVPLSLTLFKSQSKFTQLWVELTLGDNGVARSTEGATRHPLLSLHAPLPHVSRKKKGCTFCTSICHRDDYQEWELAGVPSVKWSRCQGQGPGGAWAEGELCADCSETQWEKYGKCYLGQL